MIQQKIIEFLKPNLQKIALFVLLSIIFPASIYFIADTYSGNPPVPIIIDVYGNTLLLPFTFHNKFVQEFLGILPTMLLGSINVFVSGSLFFLTIFWWYIISCLMIFFYNKIKRETKK